MSETAETLLAVYAIGLGTFLSLWLLAIGLSVAEWNDATQQYKTEYARNVFKLAGGGFVASLVWPITIVAAIGYGLYNLALGARNLFRDAMHS